jgi:hypothetical protein
MPPTPSACKINAKLKKEGLLSLLSLLRSMPCWHIDEKNHHLVNANTPRPL